MRERQLPGAGPGACGFLHCPSRLTASASLPRGHGQIAHAWRQVPPPSRACGIPDEPVQDDRMFTTPPSALAVRALARAPVLRTPPVAVQPAASVKDGVAFERDRLLEDNGIN